MKTELTDRELRTMRAALRFWQMQRERDRPGRLVAVASNDGEDEALKFHEIDELHDRLEETD